MYLLDAADVSGVLSTQQPGTGRVVGVPDVSGYRAVLELITTRCEELLEVGSLSRRVTTDYFEMTGRRPMDRRLRLSGGFLTSEPADMVFMDLQGTALTYTNEVDHEKGVVDLFNVPAGRLRITYVHGFLADEDLIFQNVPDWLKSIAKYAIQLHYRLTSMASATPANVSYAALLSEVRRELQARVYKRWQRPRVGMEFAYRTSSVPVVSLPGSDDDDITP